MIEIRNLYKTFHLKTGDVRAVQNVSLSIQDGQIYGIIGYSGAGKSTLVRCINLLEVPDSGDIRIGEILYRLKKRGYGGNVIVELYCCDPKEVLNDIERSVRWLRSQDI